MSLALARKYRPRTFADVAVQSHVANTLKGAIVRGRVANGYLLCGPRGVGKTTLARVLAMALNCENRQPDGEPCGTCASCTRIWSGASSLDVVEIDAASNRGVDDARELRERAMYAPSGAHGYKVYIVDEAHMLTREAWNTLLKILEEPPPRVVFVFATTEPQKIAQAAAPVLSRLQRFEFKRMSAADIRERLQTILAAEHVEAEPEALVAISRAADGSMRDALSVTDQVLSMDEGALTAQRVRDALGLVPEDEFLGVLDLIAEHRAGDVFALVARLADSGVDFAIFLTGLADMLRAQLTIVLGGTSPDISEAARRALAERAKRLAAGDLLRMLNALAELEPLYRKSGQQQLLVEMLLVRLALMDRTVELQELLQAVGRGGGSASDRERAPYERASAPSAPPRVVRDAAPAVTSAAASVPAPAPGTRPASSPAPAHTDRPVPRPEPPRVLADASPSARSRPVPAELHLVVERWDELVQRLRAAGKGLLADALANAMPTAISARNGGELVIRQETGNPYHERMVAERGADALAVLGEWFTGVERMVVVSESQAEAPRRLTDAMLRSDRLARLRQLDPGLGAAIDVLDLDVAD